MAHVLSVNVGRPRPVDTGRRTVLTAIWKAPVEGRVAVRGVNVAGDDQADRSVHGGPDKAVYAYAIEETREWEAELGRELGGGRVRRESHDRGHRRLGRARRRALAGRDDAS
jgi:MOSC domain-containing protein YiiM